MKEQIKPTREFLSTVYIVRDGKVLLTFNSKVNKFIPLGGHIEENELPCEAVIREAKEESGYDIELINGNDLTKNKIPQNLGIGLDIIKPEHHHINIAYLGKVIGGEMLSESDEGTELRWFSPEEISNHTEIFDDTKEKALKSIEIMKKIEEPKPGKRYRHFKGNDKIYEIIAIARDDDNLKTRYVIYKALYSGDFPTGTIWCRELNNFMGYKEFPDGTKVKRFTLIK
ncbi:MAG TPA: DUF1653 domain-containing protein [Patescibacteria group bacterium]|nr:DUF1653 domain-containing protein [Patescibacteria group bacterium]